VPAAILDGVEGQTQSRVERVLAELGDYLGARLLGAVLFGSHARGDAGPDSDVDLAVVVEDDRPRAHGAWAYVLQRADPGGRPPLQAVIWTREELSGHPWLLLDVATDGVVLQDREGIIAAELAAVRRRVEELGSRRVCLPDGSWYWDLKPGAAPGESIEF